MMRIFTVLFLIWAAACQADSESGGSSQVMNDSGPADSANYKVVVYDGQGRKVGERLLAPGTTTIEISTGTSGAKFSQKKYKAPGQGTQCDGDLCPPFITPSDGGRVTRAERPDQCPGINCPGTESTPKINPSGNKPDTQCPGVNCVEGGPVTE